MGDKKDVWQGTLALMVLKTLQALGPLHGYGNRAPHRADQRRPPGGQLRNAVPRSAETRNRKATFSSEWGTSDNNRKAKYYKLTRAGRKQLDKEAREWEQTTEILARFLAPGKESA